jgi:hypothetical protein
VTTGKNFTPTRQFFRPLNNAKSKFSSTLFASTI